MDLFSGLIYSMLGITEDLYTPLWQYRTILSADTASEARQLLSQKRR